MNARSLALVALLGTGLLSPLAAAETIALRGATVHTVGPNGTLQNATVIMQDGVIAAVGQIIGGVLDEVDGANAQRAEDKRAKDIGLAPGGSGKAA
jgi:hypothetical protein